MNKGAVARRLWMIAEPIHALTYFAPECHEAFEAAGYRGFWRGYFAGRAAPMGAVGPGVVTAAFYGFHPDFVARAVPAVWEVGRPNNAIEARLAGIDAVAVRVFADRDPRAVHEAADLLLSGVAGCSTHGRPLFAANADLDVPRQPHRMLWHATTLLRELRGDGHVTALTIAGVGPCESHLLTVARNGVPLETVKPYRGWEESDWVAAVDNLQSRGWIDRQGQLTDLGHGEREAIEALTDDLATDVLDVLGDNNTHLLLALLTPLAESVQRSGVVPYPNPVGVPPLD